MKIQHFRRLIIAATLLVTACSTSPQTYRIEAEIADSLGFPEGVTAERGSSRWTLERRVYVYGHTRRIQLSREDSLALDAVLSDPELYARPVTRSGNDCIDPLTFSIEFITDHSSRRMVLACETSSSLEAVLGILFDWPEEAH